MCEKVANRLLTDFLLLYFTNNSLIRLVLYLFFESCKYANTSHTVKFVYRIYESFG